MRSIIGTGNQTAAQELKKLIARLERHQKYKNPINCTLGSIAALIYFGLLAASCVFMKLGLDKQDDLIASSDWLECKNNDYIINGTLCTFPIPSQRSRLCDDLCSQFNGYVSTSRTLMTIDLVFLFFLPCLGFFISAFADVSKSFIYRDIEKFFLNHFGKTIIVKNKEGEASINTVPVLTYLNTTLSKLEERQIYGSYRLLNFDNDDDNDNSFSSQVENEDKILTL